MSFLDLLRSKLTARGQDALPVSHEEAKEAAAGKEEYYKVMRSLAAQAGDAESVAFYRERLRVLRELKTELEVLMAPTSEEAGRDDRNG
jgi:hypothetical protein